MLQMTTLWSKRSVSRSTSFGQKDGGMKEEARKG